MNHAKSVIAALASKTTEGPISNVIKSHPIILSRRVNSFAFPNLVASDFRFGTDFRADFVLLGPYSGGFDVHFVEIEPPGSPLFTKRHRPAKRLNEAIAQVSELKRYITQHRITQHRESILHELSKHIQANELVFGPRNFEPICNAGWHLYHPKIWFNYYFSIVIGRRNALSEEEKGIKASYNTTHEIHIMTFDHILDMAYKIDNEAEQQRMRQRRA